MNMVTDFFIEAEDIIKIYSDNRTDVRIGALRSVELRIKKGTLVSIIGPSGAGKSTLLRLIGGLDTVSSGHLKVGDTLLSSPNISTGELTVYKKTIGFLWQFPDKNLLPKLTAEEQIEFPMHPYGYSRECRKRRVLELLTAVGLKDRATHQPSQLSGGEAQRLGIAIALANNPSLVLMDEPTGELDTKNTLMIINYLKELNEQFGTTMIVVTHDHRFARMTPLTYTIKNGQISAVDRIIEETHSSEDRLEREILSYVDKYGNVRIPDDLRQELGIHQLVRFTINRDDPKRPRLEIHPVND